MQENRSMRQQSYSVDDLIQDESFQEWVFSPNGENVKYWREFVTRFPMQGNNVEEAREFLLAMKFENRAPRQLVRRMKNTLNARIDQYESLRRSASLPKKRTLTIKTEKHVSRRMFYGIAASLLLVSVFAAYFIGQQGMSGGLLNALTFEKQRTPQGKQRQVILADGTHVWLNAGSELRYPKDFSKKQIREVYLEGEAFFDVTENRSKPFIVHASGLDIRVLGTSFNVRSYAGDPVVETTLVRGKVTIASTAEDSINQVTLLPNQHASFSKDSKAIALEEVSNTEDYIGWKSGWMIFDDKPFSYIRETLERWYNVRIIIEDENSLSCTFSAKFKDKTLKEVLEIFKNTESIDYRIDGDQVFINGKLCQYENPN